MTTDEELNILEMIDNVNEDNIEKIIKNIPEYLQSESNLIIISTVEIIGIFKLHSFETQLKPLINKHHDPLVRSYILQALFELNGEKTSSFISKFIHDTSSRVSVTSLCLNYITNKNDIDLIQVRKVLMKNRWEYELCTVVINLATSYLSKSEILLLKHLMVEIQKNIPPSHTLSDEITSVLLISGGTR